MSSSNSVDETGQVDKQLIVDAIDRAKIGTLKSYRWLAEGFISNAYELVTEQGEFVLLQNKVTAAHSSDYRNYYANLRLLEVAGYTHAPKALYLSDDDGTMIATKVNGRTAVDLSDLSENDQQQVAFNISEALQELAVVQKKDVDRLYHSLGLPPSEVMSEDEDWKVYVIDRFEPFKDAAPADAPTEWIETAMADHRPRPHYDNACFHHGDTSPKNVIVGDDLKVTLIDWGGSGFYESSLETEDFGLSYAFNHIEVMRKYRESILQEICSQRGLSYETYRHRIHTRSRDIKIADVTWAYWMYCLTANGTIAEPPEKYKQILDQRIDEFEAQFNC